MGLIIERKIGESIAIMTEKGTIYVTPLMLKNSRGKFDVSGPKEIRVERQELEKYEQLRVEQSERRRQCERY